MTNDLQHERLTSILRYAPETGVFTWIQNERRPDLIGKPAGSVNSKGYVLISIDRVKHRAHRLAFFYMTGEWPTETVDHIDENKLNNAWVNLRKASKAENTFNQPTKSNNTSGAKGVTWMKNDSLWLVRVRHLGHRYTKAFAKENFTAACEFAGFLRDELHGQFANHGCGSVMLGKEGEA